MIYSMNDIGNKIAKKNRSLLFSCFISIVIALVLIISIFNFSLNAKENYITSLKEQYGSYDYIVGQANEIMDNSVANKISELKEIKDSTKMFITYINYENLNVYAAGIEPGRMSRSYFELSEDLEENQIAINLAFAEYLNKSVGDQILIKGHEFTIKEVLSSMNSTVSNVNILVLNLRNLCEINGLDNQYNFLLLELKNYNNKDSFINNYNNICDLPLYSMMEDDNILKNYNILQYTILFLAGFIVVISSFFLTIVFQRFIKKYYRDLSLMRAIGATSKQAIKIIKHQYNICIIIGIISGNIIAAVFNNFILNLLSKYIDLSITTIRYPVIKMLFISIIYGLCIKVVFSILNIRKMNILPARIGNITYSKDKNTIQIKMGIIFLVLTILTFILILMKPENAFGYSIICACCMVLSAYSLSGKVLKLLLNVLEKIFHALHFNIGKLAMKLLRYQVKKSTLVLLVATTMTMLIFVGEQFIDITNNVSIQHYKQRYISDYIVSSNSPLDFEKSMQFYGQMKKIDGIQSCIFSMGYTGMMIKDDKQYISYALSNLDEMKSLGILQYSNELSSDVCVVDSKFAYKHNIKVGNTLTLYSDIISKADDEYNSGVVHKQFKVVELVDYLTSYTFEIVIDMSNQNFLTGNKINDFLVDSALGLCYVNIANANAKEIENKLDEIKLTEPNLKWTSFEEIKKEIIETSNQRWKLLLIVLYFVIIVAFVGVINSLQTNIQEKRKEYAMLRVINIKPNQLIKIILCQVVTFCLLGIGYGGIIGYLFLKIITVAELGNISISISSIPYIGIIFSIVCLVFNIPLAKKISRKKILNELDKDIV